jgi:thioredoxin-related protein
MPIVYHYFLYLVTTPFHAQTLFLLAAALLSNCLNAQDIFQKISFQTALAKAKAENKLVFLQMESESCKQCNEVANRAFKDEELINELKNQCISIKVPANDLSWEVVRKQFNARSLSGSLFIDHSGVLLHRYNGSTSLPEAYIDHIATARLKQREAGVIL